MKLDIKQIKESVQVEDDHIILGLPLEIIKYGKTFKIEQIKWMDWEKFTYQLGVFLHTYYVICGHSKLPDSLDDLKEFRDNIRSTMSQKKALIGLLKMLKLSRLNIRFIKKKFTPDDLAELFCYVYLYNVLGVKKNFADVLKVMRTAA